MKILAVVVLLASSVSATFSQYHVYRAAGPVNFDNNGVPQMLMTVTDKAVGDKSLVPLAQAAYNTSLFQTGWDELTIAGNKDRFGNAIEALTVWYGAGYAEGYATMERINEVFAAQDYNYSSAGQIWVDKHLEYVKVNALKNSNDPFWVQTRKQLLQMQGMAAGYNARAVTEGSPRRTSFDQIYRINLLNEYDDIGPAAQALYGGVSSEFAGVRLNVNGQPARKKRGSGSSSPVPVVPISEEHCSGLVKLTNDDLFISHVTWCQYFVFVGRQHKTYKMETTVTFSSNAVLINSGGDWYQTSNKLAIIETTNEFTNNDLYKLIVPTCVPEFMRVMIASYLSTDAKSWTSVFSKEPSGTYCNQWMIIDYKLYTKGMTQEQLPDNLFWILEPIPGLIKTADMTWFLRQNGYWGSYNIPYFPEIYQKSGFQQQLDAYGPMFSWAQCSRAQIFRRDHGKISDLESMQRMMRYNNWQQDPLEAIPNCTGCNPSTSPMVAISSRGDLVPQNASFGNIANSPYQEYFAFAYFGATDAKVASGDMINDGLRGSFINGPSHDTQPVFSWNVDPTNPLAQLPGMIQTFDFDWQDVKPADI